MKKLAVTAFAFALAIATVWQPENASAAQPFLKMGKPCGTVEDLFFCLQFNPNTKEQKEISALKVKFPSKGRVLVTWQGSVYCATAPASAVIPGISIVNLEYFVFMAVQDNDDPIVYNDSGNVALGERIYEDRRFTPDSNYKIDYRRTNMWPVTITRAFDVDRASTVTYKGVGIADFRRSSTGSICNVNGGAMTVQFFPN